MTRDLTLMEEAETLAIADYSKMVGKIITVTMLSAYNDSDSIDMDGIDRIVDGKVIPADNNQSVKAEGR